MNYKIHMVVFGLVLVVWYLTGDVEHSILVLFALYAAWYRLLVYAKERRQEQVLEYIQKVKSSL
jgi:hypothetical protein